MKILFLTAIILTAAVVYGKNTKEKPNIEPCQIRVPPSKFEEFVKKHVLGESFDRTDKEKWGK